MRGVDDRSLPAVAAGLLAACCTAHLILLAAGVSVLAASAGGFLAGPGVVGVAGLWWTGPRHRRCTTRRRRWQ